MRKFSHQLATSRFKNAAHATPIKKTKCATKMKMENGIVMPSNIVFIPSIYCTKFVLANSKNFPHHKPNCDTSPVTAFAPILTTIARLEASALFLNKDDSMNANVIIINVSIYALSYVSVIFLSSCASPSRLVNPKNKAPHTNEKANSSVNNTS